MREPSKTKASGKNYKKNLIEDFSYNFLTIIRDTVYNYYNKSVAKHRHMGNLLTNGTML